MFWMFFYLPFFDILTVLCYICLWSTQQPRKCLNQAVCHGLCLGTASSCISVFMFMFHVQCFGCSLSFFLLSPCVCSFKFVFGSQRDCNPEVFLRWKLPHLPLISHRQLQLMASFRAPYLRVWLSQTDQDCCDSYSWKTSLWKGLRGHQFVFCVFGTGVCFTGAEPQVGNGRFWSCFFHLFHWHSHSVGFWENCHK